MPTPRGLSTTESSAVQHFLLLRHQVHSSPLYTSKRPSAADPLAPRKAYGQDQTNALYGVQSRASIDPFTAVPTYSQRFVREERGLPDWSKRPICRELFPPELHDTVDPVSSAGRAKRRKLVLSSVNALPSAEQAFGMVNSAEEEQYVEGEYEGETGEGAVKKPERSLLDRLNELRGDEDDENTIDVEDEDLAEEEEEEDEVYDDEDAGDYDAENYFDNGDELGDDYGDGDDGEGTF